ALSRGCTSGSSPRSHPRTKRKRSLSEVSGTRSVSSCPSISSSPSSITCFTTPKESAAMDTALPLPLLLAELTSDTMSELSTTARLLWLILSSAPTEEPIRLNVPRLRLSLSAAFDHDATRGDVELAVLTLEDRGLIVTSVG